MYDGSVCTVWSQEIDIAVVKSTAAQFHVVPKEKHVRSKPGLHSGHTDLFKLIVLWYFMLLLELCLQRHT